MGYFSPLPTLRTYHLRPHNDLLTQKARQQWLGCLGAGSQSRFLSTGEKIGMGAPFLCGKWWVGRPTVLPFPSPILFNHPNGILWIFKTGEINRVFQVDLDSEGKGPGGWADGG
jgi:hypothetical protein